MKRLSLCLFTLLSGCLSAAAAVAPVLPLGVNGGYQALLFTGEDNTGIPAGLVSVTALPTGKATGKLTTDENKTYPFTTTFNYTADLTEEDTLLGTSTTLAPINISRGTVLPALGLTLTIQHNTDGPVLKVVLSTTGVADRISNSGFRVVTFAPKVTADWAGKYTMAIEGAEAAAEGEPEGSGHAIGTVSAAGVLALAGKTGDGVKFTAALPAGSSRNYAAYLNPYKTAGSFLSGKFMLISRDPAPGFHVVAAEAPLVDLQWQKAPKATDKSYPAGFGPVGLLVTMEPWAALLKGQTLAQACGMAEGEVFDIAFGDNFNTTSYASKTPIRLGLDAKNALFVAAGGTGAPSPMLPANWKKFFSIKVNPASGAIAGSLTIIDIIPPQFSPPKPAKTVTRKLVIEGVMLRLPAIGEEAFASGLVTIPPLDPKTGTAVTAAFSFNGPFQADPLVEAMGLIAGNYQAQFQVIVLSGSAPTGVPANGATANFSVAADLKSMVFNGRTLALQGDARPLNLVYASLSNPKDALTVTLTMNLVTSEIQKCDATYVQVSGFSVKSASALSKNNPQTIVKLP